MLWLPITARATGIILDWDMLNGTGSERQVGSHNRWFEGHRFCDRKGFRSEGAALHIAARNTGDLERAREEIIRDFDVPVAFHAVDLTQLLYQLQS